MRRQAGESVGLLECLQLGDVSTLMMKDPVLRGLTPHATRREGEMQLKRLGTLRDLLAHSQPLDPAHHDFAGGLAARLDSILAFAAERG
jgi:hypothetical protein